MKSHNVKNELGFKACMLKNNKEIIIPVNDLSFDTVHITRTWIHPSGGNFSFPRPKGHFQYILMVLL